MKINRYATCVLAIAAATSMFGGKLGSGLFGGSFGDPDPVFHIPVHWRAPCGHANAVRPRYRDLAM